MIDENVFYANKPVFTQPPEPGNFMKHNKDPNLTVAVKRLISDIDDSWIFMKKAVYKDIFDQD